MTANRLYEERVSRGWTQEEAADQLRSLAVQTGLSLGVDGNTWGRWERGVIRPRAPYPRLIGLLFGQTPQSLGLAVSLPQGMSRRWPAIAPEVASDLISGTVGHVVPDLDDLEEGPVLRRDFFMTSGSLVVVPGSMAVTGGALNPATKVTSQHVEAVNEAHAYFQRLDARWGGGWARGALVRFIGDQVAPALRSGLPETVRRPMMRAAALLTHRAGWMADDMGDYPLARHNYAKARQLSRVAEDSLLFVRILSSEAYGALHRRDGSRALSLVAEALHSSSGAHRPLVAQLHSRQARAYALLGEKEKCLESLRKAAELIEGADTSDRVVRGGIDHAGLNMETAFCLRDIGDPVGALGRVESVDAAGWSPTRSSAIQTTLMASIYAQSREFEQAAKLGVRAVESLDGVHSRRAISQVAYLERQLSGIKSRDVREFRERARSLTSVS